MSSTEKTKIQCPKCKVTLTYRINSLQNVWHDNLRNGHRFRIRFHHADIEFMCRKCHTKTLLTIDSLQK